MGLLEGDKKAVFPVLEWVFANVDRLKERIYLASYLTLPEVPMEESSPELQRLLGALEERMAAFKTLHSRIVDTRSNYARAEDVRADLKTMAEEREHVLKRIERSRAKVEQRPGLARHLDTAAQLRRAAERREDLLLQKEEQRSAVSAGGRGAAQPPLSCSTPSSAPTVCSACWRTPRRSWT